MQEYLSEAIVLARDPVGEADSRVSLFTKKFGKLVGRAVSGRKITSKLSPHLEPGFIVSARLVEKKGIKIVDALKIGKINAEARDLSLLARILGDAEPDYGLWGLISSAKFSWDNILGVLGWDPRSAPCLHCGKDPGVFFLASQEFFCLTCASRLPKNELIYMERKS